jgi:hypothetical protein
VKAKQADLQAQFHLRGQLSKIGALLEPGERASSAVPAEANVNLPLRILAAFCALMLAMWSVYYLTQPPHALWHIDPGFLPGFFFLLGMVFNAAIQLLRLKVVRELVITNRRVLVLGDASSMAFRRRLKIKQEFPIDAVRVDAVRPRFPRRVEFGLRSPDGTTSVLYTSRKWLREVEWMASCLDSGVVSPRRPDSLSA